MLLDTSGLLCYFDLRDARHQEAVARFKSAHELLTHSYVLAEFVPLRRTRGLNITGAPAFAVRMLDNPLVEFVWADEKLHRAALSLLQARLDKTYSLCDAASSPLMRHYGVTDALTTDRHFE